MKTGSRRRVLVHDIEHYKVDPETGELERTAKKKEPRLKEGAEPVDRVILDVEFDPSRHVLVSDPAPAPKPAEELESDEGTDEDSGKPEDEGKPEDSESE